MDSIPVVGSWPEFRYNALDGALEILHPPKPKRKYARKAKAVSTLVEPPPAPEPPGEWKLLPHIQVVHGADAFDTLIKVVDRGAPETIAMWDGTKTKNPNTMLYSAEQKSNGCCGLKLHNGMMGPDYIRYAKKMTDEIYTIGKRIMEAYKHGYCYQFEFADDYGGGTQTGKNTGIRFLQVARAMVMHGAKWGPRWINQTHSSVIQMVHIVPSATDKLEDAIRV